METADPNQPPTGTEILRRLHAMQAALLDDTLPRNFREAEVNSTYRRGQGLALMGMACLVVQRAKEGMRWAQATTLALDELARVMSQSTSPSVRDSVLRLCSIYDRNPDGTVEGDELVSALMRDEQGFNAFIALCQLANEMASLVVQFDPSLATKSDLLLREALEFEREDVE